MNIVCFYEKEWEREYLEQKLKDFKISFFKGTISDHPDIQDNKADILCIFTDSCISKSELKHFKNVKLITTRSTGFCHIDLENTDKKKIIVCNVPSYGRNTVAEYTFGLILSLSRKICKSYAQIQEDCLSRENLQGFDLKDKIIGIVGTGSIGGFVARIAYGFGMKIIATDLKPNTNLENAFNVCYVPLEDLIASSDIITLHVPYNKNTHHMINMKNIDKIKKGTYLINTSRGGIIETQALVKALQDGIIAGAGLDVLEEENKLKESYESKLIIEPKASLHDIKLTLANHYLIDHPNVIITPHNAFNSKEAIKQILDTTIQNIINFKTGRPRNICTLAKK